MTPSRPPHRPSPTARRGSSPDPRSATLQLAMCVALATIAAAPSAQAQAPRDKDKAPAKAVDKERPQPPLEVYDWSVWVSSASQPGLNAPRVYRNAMPAFIGTSRPKVEGAELEKMYPLAPVSVAQFFGDPTDDVDVDLRAKKGAIIAHWPKAAERSGGLQWFKADFLKAPPAGLALGNLPEDHWFATKLRKVDSALYLKDENRVERFIAYDAEVNTPIPVKLRGGPDEYTLQNLTANPLLDVAVVCPVDGGGYRVGWVDKLPTAVPKDTVAEEKAKEKAKEEEKRAKDKPENKAKAADAIFDAADEEAKKAKEAKDKDKEKKDEPKPIPPEADANLRARVDQALNRQLDVTMTQGSRKDLLGMITGQARLRYELDDPTLAKDKIDLNEPMSLRPGKIAARDALAEILGAAGLSYRVTDDASLFITTALRLSEEGKKKVIIEGPPTKLALGPVVKPTDSNFRELTRDAYARRLAAQGLRAEVVQTMLDQYARDLFEPKGLVVLSHLTRDAIDEAVLLDVFPNPKKLVRVAVIVAHGVDPRLQDQARVLMKRLGDAAPKAREQAESDLYDLGPVAVPVLEDALKEKDLEIVYRAERLLMRLGRPVP